MPYLHPTPSLRTPRKGPPGRGTLFGVMPTYPPRIFGITKHPFQKVVAVAMAVVVAGRFEVFCSLQGWGG